jgi:hypothetical protein
MHVAQFGHDCSRSAMHKVYEGACTDFLGIFAWCAYPQEANRGCASMAVQYALALLDYELFMEAHRGSRTVS